MSNVAFAWDDQQDLLDELLLEIFTPTSDNAAHPPASPLGPATLTNGGASTVGSPDGPNPTFPALSPRKRKATPTTTVSSPTASSSSDESSSQSVFFAHPGCSPSGLDMAGPGSPLSAKEKRQLEMRRKRNRESMRRVRQRKRLEYSELKKLLPGLEARLVHLRERKAEHERTVANDAVLAIAATDAVPSGPVALAAAVAQLRVVEDAFRRENAVLEHAIDTYEQAFVAVRDVVAELHDQQAAAPPSQAPDDAFAWTTRATALLPTLQTADMAAFVAHSVDEVLLQVRAAQTLDEAAHTILGWRVRRAVAGSWIRFAVSKHFAHADVDVVTHKTWFVQSQSQTVNATMPQNHGMKVLAVVTTDAVVCARNLFFPGDETNYCTIYLLMRVPTARGYVIAQRSLLPTDAAQLARELGPSYSYVNLFYGMILERPDGNENMEATGCSVTFGGVASNGTETYVNTSAKDAFLAMLRWESACVGPLYRLL